jgi:hypothetical protein
VRPAVRLAAASLAPFALLLAACKPAPAPPSVAGASASQAPPVSTAAAPGVGNAAGPHLDQRERVAALGGGGELRLPAGTYVLEPRVEADTACALCPPGAEQSERPPVTIGLKVSGAGVRIVGEGPGRTIIRTRSGYGILFDGCSDCSLQGVTVTDGARDAAEKASDAAVVVRNSSVRLTDCALSDNLGAELAVEQAFVGISGIVVREGSTAVLERCSILRNSWDGVAALLGGSVVLRDVVIDGVDKSQGRTPGGGRGVGVRVATGGSATLDGTLVARHAGGLAAYGLSKLDVRDSVIEESTAWGLLAQGDATGVPELLGQGLVVHRTAACGVSVRGDVGGRLSELRLVRTAEGGRGAGPCDAVALDVEPSFEVVDAEAWLTGGRPGAAGDAETTAFREGSRALLERLAARPATSQSRYVQDRR